ncbi:hypothetical protein A2686_02060 [Candidatus Woesebacteria bacterium RIFCSPHIGHO2_01_FULL_38_10]|uniref:Uncharacterized protein n=1 Tax=Candidatus Woesebacteria bacterium RIFCSPLOWO2_01_FULL_39_10b TaxID=1802517 RepID=A0A1F8B9P2_9BACT|nr:MAG: hypothetical protein A2686_02060 [Candidatus Woesebacteria bacterium RIFCSPHIGHO2_01_FULL_38_10]OGM60762.1 MAG: hypothetical protein A2892_01830 [Candidatus Woesebacteria bacterium RIFCSPLOWO2_01_FULL_39_10b]
MKHRELLTKLERKQARSLLLRVGIYSSWNPRSYAVFERHLNKADDESLPMGERIRAANKIDQIFYRRIKKHEQNK